MLLPSPTIFQIQPSPKKPQKTKKETNNKLGMENLAPPCGLGGQRAHSHPQVPLGASQLYGGLWPRDLNPWYIRRFISRKMLMGFGVGGVRMVPHMLN